MDPDPRSAWKQTGTAVIAGSTSLNVTQTATANQQYAITNLSGSTDVAGNLLLYDGSVAAANVLYQVKVPANVPWREAWPVEAPLLATSGNAVVARVDSGSIAVSVNVSGYRISNG